MYIAIPDNFDPTTCTADQLNWVPLDKNFLKIRLNHHWCKQELVYFQHKYKINDQTVLQSQRSLYLIVKVDKICLHAVYAEFMDFMDFMESIWQQK